MLLSGSYWCQAIEALKQSKSVPLFDYQTSKYKFMTVNVHSVSERCKNDQINFKKVTCEHTEVQETYYFCHEFTQHQLFIQISQHQCSSDVGRLH